ncbi:MAG: inositol monophosphatase family protein [Bacteroidota bacterium]
MLALPDILRYVMEVSMKTGAYIKQGQKQLDSNDVELKGPQDFVTKLDKKAEEVLVDALRIILPESGFTTEEKMVSQETKEYMWIIDPIDGTSNFIHGIPMYSISIALQHNHETILGVVYDPSHEECFYAIKGQGAFMNGKPIQVSNKSTFEQAMLATGFPYAKYEKMDAYLACMKALLQECRTIRRMGSAALDLCYVACGRYEGFFEYGLSIWDIAAGALIVKEAGGVISNYQGETEFIFDKELVATNLLLKDPITQIVQAHFYENKL